MVVIVFFIYNKYLIVCLVSFVFYFFVLIMVSVFILYYFIKNFVLFLNVFKIEKWCIVGMVV